MHEMLTILTDVCSVCLSVMRLKLAAAAHAVYATYRVQGHLVQPSPNAFGLLLIVLTNVRSGFYVLPHKGGRIKH